MQLFCSRENRLYVRETFQRNNVLNSNSGRCWVLTHVYYLRVTVSGRWNTETEYVAVAGYLLPAILNSYAITLIPIITGFNYTAELEMSTFKAWHHLPPNRTHTILPFFFFFDRHIIPIFTSCSCLIIIKQVNTRCRGISSPSEHKLLRMAMHHHTVSW